MAGFNQKMEIPGSGFTLLEVLVSVFILGTVLAVVYGAYTSNLETIQRARRSAKVNQTARIVLDRMCKDLESILLEVPVTSSKVELGLVGNDEEIQGKPADRMDFTSLAHVAVGQGGLRTDLCEVGYHLEEGKEGEGLILYRRDDPIPDEDMKEGGQTLRLAKGIAGLDVTYEDGQGEPFDHWDSREQKNKRGLPPLIKIRLSILDETGHVHVFRTSVHPGVAGQTGG